jgi:antitoxin component YwqK of YwqJK toxin-antitoxin module
MTTKYEKLENGLTLVQVYFNNSEKIFEKYRIDTQARFQEKYESFYSNGNHSEIANYLNDKLHGKNEKFRKDGSISERSSYLDGKRNGLCEIYREGQLISSSNWINGVCKNG